MKLIQLSVLICCITLLNGCASISKGIAQAILEQKKEDTRRCQVVGQPFQGIFPLVKDPTSTTKVLMVHGVGKHMPGYSTELLQELSTKMGLNHVSKISKKIDLIKPFDATKKLGKLRVRRLSNEDNSHELLFYELTWSEITDHEKEVLAYDNSGDHSFRRTAINEALKKFANDTIPDQMIYLGNDREDILLSFSKAFCWMISAAEWDDLPETSKLACMPSKLSIENMRNDHYAIIAHSLGSRIVIDGLQRTARLFGDSQSEPMKTWGLADKFVQAFKEKHIPIFMLANQLPLFQLGQNLPEVTGQRDAYCRADGEHYDSRILSETDIIAFSDPNDMLSYTIPHGFSDRYIDSRLCAKTTNININVARVVDIFGIEIASPLEAHSGYHTDERVIAMIVNGIDNENTSQIVKERCTTMITTD